MSADDNKLSQTLAALRDGKSGMPVVREGLFTSSLSFGMFDVQTTMRRSNPFSLELQYARAMMSFQLFQPCPQHILIVGLGGGSLSKYCHLQFPDARVTSVEIDERVIALREQFHIPADSDRFRIVHADAADFLAGMSSGHGTADVILLDGFNASGLPDALSSQSFYDDCYAALRTGGILIANLLDHDPRVGIYMERIGRACGGKLLCTAARREGNLIAIGLKRERLPLWPELHARARAIDLSTGLNLSLHVKRMESRHRAESNGLRGMACWSA